MNRFVHGVVTLALGAGLGLGMLSASAADTGTASTPDYSKERASFVKEIKAKEADPKAFQQAIRAGKDRSLLCGFCHGVDGNRVRKGVPNLAGQNPSYLLQQIQRFEDGRRKSFPMNGVTKSFTHDDKVNLVIYFSSQKVKPHPFDAQAAQQGERIYRGVCFRCHGENGRGEKGYARLAGQQQDYAIAQLKRFRHNALHPEDTEDRARHSVLMEQVAQHLSDEDIQDLAAYIASLR